MIERIDALSQRSPDNLSACVTVDGQTVSDGFRLKEKRSVVAIDPNRTLAGSKSRSAATWVPARYPPRLPRTTSVVRIKGG
jgi:hypothetical protein